LTIDLLVWDFDKASEYLSSKGIEWTAEISRPPFKQQSSGYLKVIKQESDQGAYKLTLCKVTDDFR